MQCCSEGCFQLLLTPFIGQEVSQPFMHTTLAHILILTVSWDQLSSKSCAPFVPSWGYETQLQLRVYFCPDFLCTSIPFNSASPKTSKTPWLTLWSNRKSGADYGMMKQGEMQACEGISVQTHKPWCSPVCFEGQIVLGLNPACTFQPNEV